MSRIKEHKPKKQSFLITIKGEGVSAFIQAVKREGMEYMPTSNLGEFKVYYNYTRQVMHLGAAFHELYNKSQVERLKAALTNLVHAVEAGKDYHAPVLDAKEALKSVQ